MFRYEEYANGATKIIEKREGGISSVGTVGVIREGEEPIKVIENETEYKKYTWCKDWKKVKEEDQNIIFLAFGKDRLREQYKNNIQKLKHPDKLLTISKSYLIAIGYNEPCSRCGGSGEHSYNPRYGRTCFKCAGNKIQLVKPTKTQINKMMKEYPNGLKNSEHNIKGKGEYLLKPVK